MSAFLDTSQNGKVFHNLNKYGKLLFSLIYFTIDNTKAK